MALIILVQERGKAGPPMRTSVRKSSLAERIDFYHLIEQNNKTFTISIPLAVAFYMRVLKYIGLVSQ